MGIECSLCGSSEVDLFGIKKDRPSVDQEFIDFKIMKCNHCGVFFTVYPENWNVYSIYEEDKYHVARQDQTNHAYYEDRFNHDCNVARMRLDRLAKYVPSYHGKKFLDIGCANGALVYEAYQRGMDSYGTDISSYIIEKASNKLNELGVHANRFEVNNVDQDELPFNGFDVVQMNDVIEHLTDPINALLRVRRSMEIDGYLFIDTPNFDDETVTKDILNSHHCKPIEHTLFFTEKALRFVTGSAGFALKDQYKPIPGKIVMVVQK